MTMKQRVVLLSTLMLAPVGAFAAGGEPGFYLGGGYTGAKLDLDVIDKDADLGVLFVRGGYQINQNIAAEIRLGTGVDDDRVYGVKVEAEDVYGAYLKAGLPTTVGLYPYVLLGMTHAKLKASGGGVRDSDSGSDVSYGIGVDYWFSNKISAGLEWANLYDKDGDEITGVSASMNFKF